MVGNGGVLVFLAGLALAWPVLRTHTLSAWWFVLCTARTRTGKDTLAGWLKGPRPPGVRCAGPPLPPRSRAVLSATDHRFAVVARAIRCVRGATRPFPSAGLLRPWFPEASRYPLVGKARSGSVLAFRVRGATHCPAARAVRSGGASLQRSLRLGGMT
jgi:hypothetical protein